jgi:hypothetical protein
MALRCAMLCAQRSRRIAHISSHAHVVYLGNFGSSRFCHLLTDPSYLRFHVDGATCARPCRRRPFMQLPRCHVDGAAFMQLPRCHVDGATFMQLPRGRQRFQDVRGASAHGGSRPE